MPALSAHHGLLRSAARAALAAAIATLALAGCGESGNGDPITVSPEDGSGQPEQAAEPRGPLEPTNVGPVIVSMTPEDVREAFGEPDRVQGEGPAAVHYELEDGTLTIVFDRETRLMNGYATNARSLATRDGVRVGDRWPPVARALSELLTDDRGGPPKESDGSYVLSLEQPGTLPALVFDVRDGHITRISGGVSPPGT